MPLGTAVAQELEQKVGDSIPGPCNHAIPCNRQDTESQIAPDAVPLFCECAPDEHGSLCLSV